MRKRETRDYYGPAGIFSTDNPQSDWMQINAEEGEEYEEYVEAEYDLGDEYQLFAGCSTCGWWYTVHYFDGQDAPESREAVETRLRREHLKSGCQKELQISE